MGKPGTMTHRYLTVWFYLTAFPHCTSAVLVISHTITMGLKSIGGSIILNIPLSSVFISHSCHVQAFLLERTISIHNLNYVYHLLSHLLRSSVIHKTVQNSTRTQDISLPSSLKFYNKTISPMGLWLESITNLKIVCIETKSYESGSSGKTVKCTCNTLTNRCDVRHH